jgi:hypothetical protein
MLQPSITFSGFVIHEPVTVLTDLLLCVACVHYFIIVRKSRANYWPYFFGCMVLTPLIGAFGHALYTDKNNILQLISRSWGIVSVFFASLGSITMIQKSVVTRFLNWFAFLQVVTALSLLVWLNQFWIVKVNSTLGLGILVGGTQVYLKSKSNPGSNYILIGIGINALAGLVHNLEFSISKWFNYNDLGHFILIVGLYFIAKGVIQFQKSKHV